LKRQGPGQGFVTSLMIICSIADSSKSNFLVLPKNCRLNFNMFFVHALKINTCNFMGMAGQAVDAMVHGKGKYALIRDSEDFQTGIYDKPLPCFGCGIGWFS
jgi:hypothetical protein